MLETRRAQVATILVTAGALLSGCGKAHTDPARDHAQAACDTWRDVVSQADDGYRPMLDDMDRMVSDAASAADANGRYTRLWQDMKEYRLFASEGMNTNRTDYVSADCSDALAR